MPGSVAGLLAAPARWRFVPRFLRAGYALALKRAFALARWPIVKNVPGLGQMKLEPWDLIDSRIFFFNVWEPAVSRFMREAIKPGMVVADIGANIGYHTLLMSRAVGPGGHVFAVEPSPEIRGRLQDALIRNGVMNVTVIPYGISDKAERRSFTLSDANLGASRFGAVSEGEDGIELRRLADVIPPAMLGRLSFLKIDVEGMEAQVMRDISRLLPSLPQELTICAELRMDDAMRTIVGEFQAAGMECLVLPNRYSMFAYPAHPLQAEKVDDPGAGQLDVALVRR